MTSPPPASVAAAQPPLPGGVSLAKRPAVAGKGEAASAQSSVMAAQPKADALVLVMARNTFYYASSQNLLKVALGQFILILVLLAVLVRISAFTASRDYYFPTQTNNLLISERPLYEPILNDAELVAWVEEALQATFTFGYYDYLTRLQEARTYYTLRGWSTFTQALQQSTILNLIGAVKSENIVGTNQVVTVALRPGTKPRILREGVVGGLYVWELQVDIDISLINATQQSRFSWEATLQVERQPTMESRFGIGISSMIVRNPTQ